MKPWSYYNENDQKIAVWLKELIKAGLIADGEVDTRSIVDVRVDDLRGFVQCHFFAGIGGWSYGLRLAGWPDDRKCWTGSCPCPPFSSAGKKKACPRCAGESPVPHVGRTGVFVCCWCGHEWAADDRHLWPEMWRLIRDGRPDTFFGEQVSSEDGRVWLSLVRASLEILGYAVGGRDSCGPRVGAYDIRQRLWFVADTVSAGRAERWAVTRGGSVAGGGSVGLVADTESQHDRGRERRQGGRLKPSDSGFPGCGCWDVDAFHRTIGMYPWERCSNAGLMADTERRTTERQRHDMAGAQSSLEGAAQERERIRPDAWDGEPASELGDSCRERLDQRGGFGRLQREAVGSHTWEAAIGAGRTPCFWSDVEWIPCTDGKWRPVEPGTFPLVARLPKGVGLRGDPCEPFHEAEARIMRLRGYGNAIKPELAAEFIGAYMDITR